MKNYFIASKTKIFSRSRVPGEFKTLWDAVKIASDNNVSGLPDTTHKNGLESPASQVASAFGGLFVTKVKNNFEYTDINWQVSNGHKKINQYIDPSHS